VDNPTAIRHLGTSASGDLTFKCSAKALLSHRFLLPCILILSTMAFSNGPGPTTTADSGERTAAEVGRDCTTDQCSTARYGCASCVEINIHLPPNAWVTKTHCYTNADYPGDRPRHQLVEVPCGIDISWSRFDTPIVTATSEGVTVHTIYHNRSSDRARDVKLTTEWHLIDK
jgi:hypothetical protein